MKASETRFQPIIEGTKQYVVPLFQRPYSWKKSQWETLWDDLFELYENDEPKYHFIGSLVTVPTMSVPEGVTKYLLIDGQQRLTTIFILLALLRDLANQSGSEELAREINETLLINPFKKGDDQFKLLPTQIDRETFRQLINGKIDFDELKPTDDGILGCYRYFRRMVITRDIDIAILKNVITNRLSVVSIVLDRDDNPHIVFESLNAKGQDLTQADLIRNYFFMQTHPDQHDTINEQYWRPMQSGLGDKLTEFVRHYLMRDGAIVKQNEIYFTLKNRIEEGNALDALQELARFARYYEKLLYPQKEASSTLQYYLHRLNRFETTTAYPLLLNCYEDYANGHLTHDEFAETLRIIENYVIRRYICNRPTNTLNKLFPALYGQSVKYPNFVEGVRTELQKRDYPRDEEFKERLIQARMYGGAERNTKTRVILESLEGFAKHKERVGIDDTITIEHVMPQTLSDWWMEQMGVNAEQDHELLLHTLGNLTLTGYNSELSNEPYPKKRERFAQSHFELNRYFANVDMWSRNDIEQRAQVLANQALKIWPYFGDITETIARSDNVTGKTPMHLTILGETHSVGSWRDVMVSFLNTVAELEPEAFAQIVEQYQRFVSADVGNIRSGRSRQLKNGYYVDVNVSARDVYRFCTNVVELVGLTSDDWRIEVK